jgi:hypothetical protein
MSEVAKILGVELGERFKLNLYYEYDKKYYGDNEYYLCDEGIKLDKKDHLCMSADLLLWILNGRISIKRKPWKPHVDDEFWFVVPEGDIYSDTWKKYPEQLLLYKIGNCYRFGEEALNNRDKWMKFYASDEVMEV